MEHGVNATYMYVQGGQKISLQLLSISSPNVDQVSTYFHRHILWKSCNNVITKYTTAP